MKKTLELASIRATLNAAIHARKERQQRLGDDFPTSVTLLQCEIDALRSACETLDNAMGVVLVEAKKSAYRVVDIVDVKSGPCPSCSKTMQFGDEMPEERMCEECATR